MLPIKRNCRFLIDKEKGKSDGRLRYRIRWGKNTVAFNVGYRVELEKWIADAQRCKANSTHGEEKLSGNEINKAIQFYENTIEDLFYKYEQEEVYPTKEQLRNDVNLSIRTDNNDNSIITVQELFSRFIKDQSVKKAWTTHTIKRVKTVQNHLRKFHKRLTTDKINEDTLQSFIEYQIKKNLKNSTIEKNHKTFTWAMRWGTQNGYIKTDAHKTFKPKFKGVNNKEVIYLTWEELIKLYNFDFGKNKHLEQTRDVFCFCCFTGLRYSDVKKLTKDDIHESYIEVVTQKTIDRLIIELNKYSKSILKKYKKSILKGNKALPVISNQKMNGQLKEVSRLIGLNSPIRQVYFIGNKRVEKVSEKWELITTHCGRKTFVVNALRLGIPAEVIMRWTGHSDYKSMKPYVKIVDELKKQEMDKFNKM